jgi:hypothetical protein
LKEEVMTAYTYWGDLLGVSGYYKLNPATAKEILNDFYNTTFITLSDYCRTHCESVKILMFSDSLLIYGQDAFSILPELCNVYVKLLGKGLLLRGGMVKGKLEMEPRYTLDNFQKNLPTDDILARVIGLEKAKKGARLLLERDIAVELLADHKDWLTNEGYIRSIREGLGQEGIDSILRKIAPTPEQDNYECLYFWDCNQNPNNNEITFSDIIKDLGSIQVMYRKNIAEHYKESISLLKRCQKRQSITVER